MNTPLEARDASDGHFAAARNHAPLRIAIVSPVPTDPPYAGNRARILEFVRYLTAQGHEVHFLFANYEPGDLPAMRARFGERFVFVETGKPPALRARWSLLWRRWARRLGVKSADSWLVDSWFDARIGAAARALVEARNIDTVLCVYVFTSAVGDAVRGLAHSVIDCQDLFGDRHLMYRQAGIRPTWFSTTVADETRALKRMDAVIAIEENEAAILRARGHPRVHCVGPLVTVPVAPLADPCQPTLLFVGSRNRINVVALQRFVCDVWPRIQQAIPDAEFLIAGACGRSGPWPAGVRALGELPSIDAAYQQGAVTINPVEFGTGFCIKTMEALGFGRPLVTSPSGARGLNLAVMPFVRVADTPDDFSRACVELLNNAEGRTQLGAAARRYAQHWNALQTHALEGALHPEATR